MINVSFPIKKNLLIEEELNFQGMKKMPACAAYGRVATRMNRKV